METYVSSRWRGSMTGETSNIVREFDVDVKVCDCSNKQAGLSWPLPVDAKLERMLETVKSFGERTSRREIAAAIIAMFEDVTAEKLSSLLRRYRLATVGDVLGKPADDSNVVHLKEYTRPGPR